MRNETRKNHIRNARCRLHRVSMAVAEIVNTRVAQSDSLVGGSVCARIRIGARERVCESKMKTAFYTSYFAVHMSYFGVFASASKCAAPARSD